MWQIGERTIWHSSSCPHWDIRRFASNTGYVAEQVPFLPTKERNLSGLDPKDPKFYWEEYVDSAVLSFQQRFAFYENSLPAHGGYRRVSLNFSMRLDRNLRLRAYAQRDSSRYEIYVSTGILLAIEDAAHAICCDTVELFVNPEVDLWKSSYPGGIRSLAELLSLRDLNAVFCDYSDGFASYPAEAVEKIAKRCAEIKAEKNIVDDIPPLFCASSGFEFLHLGFTGIPWSPTRQIFADQLSLVSIVWLIGHEDAHRYLGHLHYFAVTMGATPFNELIADYPNEDLQQARRCAELDADSASTMRIIDLAYDVETFGMMFDIMDPKIRSQFWLPHTEVSGFTDFQRNFALRVLVGASILPLLLFQINLQQAHAFNSRNYPLLAHRLLNVIFEIFNRAMATQNLKAHQLTGKVTEFDEVMAFCGGASIDMQVMYEELLAAKGIASEHAFRRLDLGVDPEVFFSMQFAECFAIFLCHLHAIPSPYLSEAASKGAIWQQSMQLLADFIKTKREAMIFAVDSFAEPRRLANAGDAMRLRKIEEDLQSYRNNIDYLSTFVW